MNADPYPVTHRLVGTHEIRFMLGGLHREQTRRITRRPDFPPPVAELANGKVWRREDVKAWIHRRHQPGS